MGKSPGKWLKTLLFGKKSFRSRSTKNRDSAEASSEREYLRGKETDTGNNSPVISEPVLVNTYSNTAIQITEKETKETQSNLAASGPAMPAVSKQVAANQNLGILVSDSSIDTDKLRKEESAATKAQAAFRGFLARRAYHALKGIIKLQAMVRGQIVRRQAVITLCTMHSIIRVQALARGKIVRCSNSAPRFSTQVLLAKTKGYDLIDTLKESFSSNKFVIKLLSSTVDRKPLQLQFDKGNPNSVLIWLERWEKTKFWKPISRPKINLDPKSHSKTQSNKAKRISKSFESEKEKNNINNPRRFSLSPSTAESAQENPKSKRKPRAFSSSMSEVEIRKLSNNVVMKSKIISNNLDLGGDNSASKTVPDVNPQIEDNLSTNGDSSVQKTNRRSSFSLKSENNNTENNNSNNNNNNNNTVLPSYMAATESARARVRGQISPRVITGGSDSSERNEKNGGAMRRHSLPTGSINGKLNLQSPRTQRLVQNSGGGKERLIKGDRSLSSRDGNERPIQVEWRR